MNKRKKTSKISEAVIDLDLYPSPNSEEKGTPMRPIFCLKRREKIEEIEKTEDCFILDFDPDDVSKFSASRNLANKDSTCDLSIIAEKGQVACRDYPHPRHVCLKYPFAKTAHESHCKLCYCFVCDLAAPCGNWKGKSGHCHAIDNEAWRLERKVKRKKSQIDYKASTSLG